jgi:hypothetical protein
MLQFSSLKLSVIVYFTLLEIRIAVPLLLIWELWNTEYPRNLHFFSILLTPAICVSLLSLVSHKKIMSDPFLVTVSSFVCVFFPGLEILREQTF